MRFRWLQSIRQSMHSQRRAAALLLKVFLAVPTANGKGKGTYYFANGDRYEGDIQNGAMTGRGTYFYSNGLRSEGEYANGALRGQGAF